MKVKAKILISQTRMMNLAINVNDQTSAGGIIGAHIIDRISSTHFQNFSREFVDNYSGKYELFSWAHGPCNETAGITDIMKYLNCSFTEDFMRYIVDETDNHVEELTFYKHSLDTGVSK